ncbi:MAG: chemotaxis protein CheY [Frankiales bacterium]|nr:chemotaxis protein CheY [Frankiales bacterium]
MASILLVEDDPTVTEVVVSYLDRAQHQTRSVSDGGDAARALDGANSNDFDLVILDVMLPTLDGIEVCRRLRHTRRDLPVIMLSALGQEDDRIAGLEVGADDYVTKPFSPRELVLRVESVLRRARSDGQPPQVLSVGPIRVDTAARTATKNGVELNLTVREMDVLTFLMSRPGTAFSRLELMSSVWGWTFGDQSTVTVHVRRIREKIEDDARRPRLIQTVWGVGYRMDADE